MDRQVIWLLTDLRSLRPDETFDLTYWRERFEQALSSHMDDESRQALLIEYAKALDKVEQSILMKGNDPTPFRVARAADRRALCLKEASLKWDGAQGGEDELGRIFAREIAAGRMIPDDVPGALSAGRGRAAEHRRRSPFKRWILTKIFN